MSEPGDRRLVLEDFWERFGGGIVVAGIIAAIVFFLGLGSRSPKPTLKQSFAAEVAGDYENCISGAVLSLESKTMTGTLSSPDSDAVSKGAWTTDGKAIFVRIDGPAGSLSRTLVVYVEGNFTYLVPPPATEAKLNDSFVMFDPDEDPPDDDRP